MKNREVGFGTNLVFGGSECGRDIITVGLLCMFLGEGEYGKW